MARGNQGRAIFEDDRDRQRFLETLGASCEKTGWRVHAYVLMGNHYHLLIETPEPDPVVGMNKYQLPRTDPFTFTRTDPSAAEC
jgi:putative transposase